MIQRRLAAYLAVMRTLLASHPGTRLGIDYDKPTKERTLQTRVQNWKELYLLSGQMHCDIILIVSD
jgi:hypothetical protein